MSKNGARIAGGGPHWNDDRGAVQVWDWDGESWVQTGSSQRGINVKDLVGISLAMSNNGNYLVIGAMDSESNRRRGSVTVFQYDELTANWIKRGYHFTGFYPYDCMGCGYDSLSITEDGNYIAMGAQGGSYVKVFEWGGSNWKLLGESIKNDDYTMFGASVELSSKEGNLTVAIGSPHDPPEGAIYVYGWNGNEWEELLGSPIRIQDTEAIGYSIAISDNGNTLMTQSYYSPFVFDWTGVDYTQRGGPIFVIAGDHYGNVFARAELMIDMSGDGNVVVVGLPQDEDGFMSCTCEGHAKSFVWKRPT